MVRAHLLETSLLLGVGTEVLRLEREWVVIGQTIWSTVKRPINKGPQGYGWYRSIIYTGGIVGSYTPRFPLIILAFGPLARVTLYPHSRTKAHTILLAFGLGGA